MAWKESDRVSERLEFVRLGSQQGANISQLCRRFGVSRKTGYKWLRRYRASGDKAVEDRSRRPLRSPGRTSQAMEQEVLKVRSAHPSWGGRKLRRLLLDRGIPSVPSASTITAILHRHGLISEEVSSQHRAFSRFERSQPNELWQIDFKGDFKLTTGKKCYPLTILDDHSRYSLGIKACGNQRRTTVQGYLRQVFDRYGIPRAVYVDNGNPWGTAYRWARHTRFSVWLMRHDIEVIHGRPFHPQGRGKLERFHRTLKLEVLQEKRFSSLRRVQSCFDPWRTIYNHHRPHDALDLNVPASRYQVSDRSFDEITSHYEYSDRFETRRANRASEIKFHGRTYRLSEVFIDQRIGLCPTQQDGIWDVYFCRFVIGQVNEHTGKFSRTSRLAEFQSVP